MIFVVGCVNKSTTNAFCGIVDNTIYQSDRTKPNQTKPNQTKPNQTKPNQTKPNQNRF
ncbi:hypothetical protein PDY_30200 [Photobacterium damselae subsp. damselae]|nr:hypothetical protein PDY_30200 [Photobacterium damselae subsp. damselae]